METFMPHATLRYVAYGDSVTQGFTASGIDKTYSFILAEKNSWQLINLGIAGRASVAGDGALIGSLHADIITILMGVNDWQSGVSLERYSENMENILHTIRTVQPQVPVYLITPLWVSPDWSTPNAEFDLELYRRDLRDMVSFLGDENLYIVEGPDLIDHDKRYFDRAAVHPNDLGFAMMAERLSATIKAPMQ
jgi:lysophospholipase L1-like esterase